jgi:hypothetical protein
MVTMSKRSKSEAQSDPVYDEKYPARRILRVIACEITKSWQSADGREIVSIDTASPWAVEAVTGETDFDVLREQIIEFQ